MSELASHHPTRTVAALAAMDFPERLATLRHEKGLTQQSLADSVGVHVTQLRRYEAGKSQPTLLTLRKLAVSLGVSADLLLFDADERGPEEDLRLPFEAASQLDPDEKRLVRELIDGLRLKREVKRLAAAKG